MMKISRSAVYAVYGLVYLSWKKGGALCTISEIAEYWQMPSDLMAKVFQQLARAGIVASKRGINGGFYLLKEPKNVSLFEIIEAIDGTFQKDDCILRSDSCSIDHSCRFKEEWHAVVTSFYELLRRNTLEEIARIEGRRKSLDTARQNR
ncbi:MAG: Rrf2 family transcriptional regulator [Candidatus Omnitrophica bacterium]|nr:Rrf2 family transcriptional regulator [Candidatus Omnitrophota bacterium]